MMRHGGYQSDRGRAATDHDNAFARVIERFGPMLGMKQLPLKLIDAREIRGITRLIVIIATATKDELAAHSDLLTGIAALSGHPPAFFE